MTGVEIVIQNWLYDITNNQRLTLKGENYRGDFNFTDAVAKQN